MAVYAILNTQKVSTEAKKLQKIKYDHSLPVCSLFLVSFSPCIEYSLDSK